MDLTINGITYHITQHQQSSPLPSLLLLHGFMGSSRVFDHLIPRLRNICNPITVDLLGHGQTTVPPKHGRFASDHQLTDLHQIIEQLAPSPLFLHGYSMGGRLALRFALRYPQHISGLILESTNYGIEDQELRRQRKRVDKERAQAIENDYDSFLEEWQTLPLFDNEVSVPGKLEEQYREIQQLQQPSAMANSLRGFGAAQMPAVHDQLGTLTMPVLLLAGQQDRKYRSILQQMEERIRNSTFHIIKDAGHRIHLENPQAFIDHVKAFVLCAS